MSHLTPGQFVDLAEGVQAETSVPHLATCDACRRQLADVRAILSDAAAAAEAPEPSPLYWEHFSARVRDAVADENARPRSWRERLLVPQVIVPLLGSVLAVTLLAVLLPRIHDTTAIPSTPLPMSSSTAMLLSLPPLQPLGAADDPELGLVADYGTTLGWDEMREEMALPAPDGVTTSSAVVVDALTIDEQRELQRLLADEMAQPSALEIRS